MKASKGHSEVHRGLQEGVAGAGEASSTSRNITTYYRGQCWFIVMQSLGPVRAWKWKMYFSSTPFGAGPRMQVVSVMCAKSQAPSQASSICTEQHGLVPVIKQAQTQVTS